MKKIFAVLAVLSLGAASIFAQPKLKSASAGTEYKLTYELNGGVQNSANKDRYIEKQTVKLEAPTKAGYDFKGWFWDKDFNNALPNNTFTGKADDLKVYAKWEMSDVFIKEYAKNMVTIIPAGNKVELDDFAGKAGTVVINAYEISKYEVTQGLYKSVMGTNPSNFEGSERPVENVTWYDAVKFCNELTKKTMGESECCYKITEDRWGGISEVTCDFSKKGFRLPKETEWEMAARGGLEGGWDNKYSGTNSYSDLRDYAWYDGNSNYGTHDAGTKKPNAAGLYDMSGNVWEWCWDLYSESGSGRVYRGGSCSSIDNYCAVDYRYGSYPSSRGDGLGFRVCRGL